MKRTFWQISIWWPRTCGVALALAAGGPAQGEPVEAPEYSRDGVYVALDLHELPVMLAALRRGALGRLREEPGVAAGAASALGILEAQRSLWLLRYRNLVASGADTTPFDAFRFAVLSGDWLDLRGAEVLMWFVPLESGPDMLMPVSGSVLWRPGGSDAFADRMHEVVRQELDPRVQQQFQVAPDQQLGSHPAHVLRGNYRAWLARIGDRFLFGWGDIAANGRLERRRSRHPCMGFRYDVGRLLDGLERSFGDEADLRIVRAWSTAIGFGPRISQRYLLQDLGAELEESLAIDFSGNRSVLGALASSHRALPPQPLPAGGLLQLRMSFDMPRLLEAIDSMLALAGVATSGELSLASDLQRACTGGLAVAVVAPAPGRPEPRLYLSLGVADAEAMQRLLTRLAGALGATLVPVSSDDGPAWRFSAPGLAAAWQPALWLHDGTLHVAAGVLGLRDLRRAAASGASTVLDAGPDSAGAAAEALPGFELRYDLPALYAAFDAARPVLRALANGATAEWIASAPPADEVCPHVGRGRILLRRETDDLVLYARGPEGGMFCQLLWPLWLSPLARLWADSLVADGERFVEPLIKPRLRRLHTALQDYEVRTGQRCPSLGALLAAGSAVADDLLVFGDPHAEVVLHDGVPVARSSFRYFAAETRLGEEDVALLTVRPSNRMHFWVLRDGRVRERSVDAARMLRDSPENQIPGRIAELLR